MMQGRLLRNGRMPLRAILDMASSKTGMIPSQQLGQFQTLDSTFSRFTFSSSTVVESSSSLRSSTTNETWRNHQRHWNLYRNFATTTTTTTTDNNNDNEEEKSEDTTITTITTMEEETDTETQEDTPNDESSETSPLPAVEKEPENVLASLAEGYTPGQAMFHLHKKGTVVTLPEIRDLIKSVVPGKRKHASVLRNALKEYKKNRGLVLGREEGALAMEALRKALVPVENVTGQDKLKNALIVLDMFLDPATGLYFASPTPPVDDVFALLLEGLVEENLPTVETEQEEDDEDDDDEEGDEEEDDGGEVAQTYYVPEKGKKRRFRKLLRKLQLIPHATPKKVEPRGDETPEQLSERIADTTIRIIEILNMRKSRPYRKMKKRAARKYLKSIRIHHGPTPNTVHLATQIMLHVRGSAMEEIVTPCKDNRVPIKPETLALIEEHAAAAAAAAVEEQSEADEESSSDDSSESGEDATDSETKKE